MALPVDIRFDFANWNALTHGNVTIVIFLFAFRYVSWIQAICLCLMLCNKGVLVPGSWPHPLLVWPIRKSAEEDILIYLANIAFLGS